jgi:inner membrane protein
MTLIDHIAGAILLSHSRRAVASQKTLVAACLVAAIFPDTMTLVYKQGSLGFLYHRLFMDSILIAPIYSLILALPFYLLCRRRGIPFLLCYLMTLISYNLHIFLDLITEYGTPIFYPLSATPYSLDIVHSFDPLAIAISVIVIAAFVYMTIRKRLLGLRVVAALSAVYLLYFSVTMVSKNHASTIYQKFISRGFPDASYTATVPMTFWRWRAIAQTADSYIVLSGDTANIEKRDILDKTQLLEGQRNDPYVRGFLFYARYPAIDSRKDTIFLTNAAYSQKSFRLTLLLDRDGRILKQDLSGFDLDDK